MALPFIPIVQVEDPVDYTDSDGAVWRRAGHCCHCGACCQGDVDDAQVSPCRYLQTDSQGVLQCAGRDTASYARGCNVWPSVPQHIADYPDCTYTFEKVSP